MPEMPYRILSIKEICTSQSPKMGRRFGSSQAMAKTDRPQIHPAQEEQREEENQIIYNIYASLEIAQFFLSIIFRNRY